MDHSEAEAYYKAKKRVKKKKGFYSHLGVFIAVCTFFLVINILKYNGKIWFYWPMLGWGIGLLSHYFSVFGLPGGAMSEEWEEEELEKELARQRRLHRNSVEPTHPIESDEEDELELREFKKLRKEWDDKDFV